MVLWWICELVPFLCGNIFKRERASFGTDQIGALEIHIKTIWYLNEGWYSNSNESRVSSWIFNESLSLCLIIVDFDWTQPLRVLRSASFVGDYWLRLAQLSLDCNLITTNIRPAKFWWKEILVNCLPKYYISIVSFVLKGIAA